MIIARRTTDRTLFDFPCVSLIQAAFLYSRRSRSPSASMIVLSAADVFRVASMFSTDKLIHLMSGAFVQLSADAGVNSPQRLAIDNDSSSRRTLFMPTHADGVGTAIKVVSLPTGEGTAVPNAGLHSTTLVLDEGTGTVKGVLNSRHLTALRTAAGKEQPLKVYYRRTR